MPDLTYTKVSQPSGVSGATARTAVSPSNLTVAVLTGTSPFIYAFPWSQSGFGSKFSNPGILPGNGSGLAFSPSSNALVLGQTSSPFIAGYPWNDSTGFGTKYSNPASLPAGAGAKVAFSPDGSVVALAHATTPFVSAYAFNATTGFGSKFSAPASPPANTGVGVAFSPSGATLVVGNITTTPFISAYPWSNSTGFGSKFSNPSNLPPGGVQSVAFSPSGAAIVAASSSSPFIIAWAWNDSTGWGAKYADPGTLPAGSGNFVAFSSDGKYVAIGHNTSPFVTIYNWDDINGFGSKVTDPTSLPDAAGQTVSFGQDYSLIIGVGTSTDVNGYVINPPVNTVAPAVTGTAQVGQTLTTDNGTWTNSPTGYAYQWQRADDNGFTTNVTNIGTNANTYLLTSSENGKYVRCQVTASNAGGAGSAANSNVKGPVLPAVPTNSVAPSCSPSSGTTLTSFVFSSGTWTGSPTGWLWEDAQQSVDTYPQSYTLVVAGFTAPDTNYNGTWTLVYQGGGFWSATAGGATVQLIREDAFNWFVQLSNATSDPSYTNDPTYNDPWQPILQDLSDAGGASTPPSTLTPSPTWTQFSTSQNPSLLGSTFGVGTWRTRLTASNAGGPSAPASGTTITVNSAGGSSNNLLLLGVG